jgi:hypothetical protein
VNVVEGEGPRLARRVLDSNDMGAVIAGVLDDIEPEGFATLLGTPELRPRKSNRPIVQAQGALALQDCATSQNGAA